jgi:tRNA guanosine-2'-O-methyltransferase
LDILNQEVFYKNLFSKLMPWLTSHHFTIRLFSQYVVVKSWNFCMSSPTELQHIAQSSPSAIMIGFLQNNAECVKHMKKSSDNYFTGGEFHPLADLSGMC